nr:NAD(P)-binding domain-containing protein [uncultured Methanoregula sp.]
MNGHADHPGFSRETIGIIGAGHLGMSLADALISHGFPRENLLISHAGSPATRAAIIDAGLENNLSGNREICGRSSVIFITVRPQSVATLEGLPFPRDGLVISCVAGIPRASFEKSLGIEVIRMMPSGPDTIRHNKGIAAICPGHTKLAGLLSGMGLDVRVLPEEESMHVFTAGVCLPAAILAYRATGREPDDGIFKAGHEFPLLAGMYAWAKEVVPDFASRSDEEIYIAKMCTPGGVTSAIVLSIRSGNSLSVALRAGITRSREISGE